MKCLLLCATIFFALLFLAPTSGATLPQPSHPAASSGGSVYTYTTPLDSNIEEVAVSPNGEWIAAATDNHYLYVFSPPGGSGGPISPSNPIDLPADAISLAVSNTGPGGNPLVAVAYNGTVAVYNASSPTPWWTYSNFTASGTASVVSLAIDQDGNAVAAVSVVAPPSGTKYYAYAYLNGSGGRQQFWSSYPNADIPADVSMDVDGSRVAVGITFDGQAFVQLFSSTGGEPQNWTPLSQNGDSYTIAWGGVSGNGAAIAEVSESGFSITTSPSEPAAISTLIRASGLSMSYTGCEELVTYGDNAYYYNATDPSTDACNSTRFVSSLWSTWEWNATFSSAVTGALAQDNPSYFVIAVSNQLNWYFAYPAMPDSPKAAYRTISVGGNGTVDSAAISSGGGVSAVGSTYSVGTSGEFTLALDSGVPIPSPLTVTPVALASSPGNSTASEEIKWSAPPVNGFDQIIISVTPLTGGGSISVPIVTSYEQTSVIVGGLGFSANYTVTLTFLSYGGYVKVVSPSQVFETTSAPPLQDPFGMLEYVAIGLLIAGIVAYVILVLRFPKEQEVAPSKSATRAAPPQAVPPRQTMPPNMPPPPPQRMPPPPPNQGVR